MITSRTGAAGKKRQNFGFEVPWHLPVMIAFKRLEMVGDTCIRQRLVHIPIRLEQPVLKSHVHLDSVHFLEIERISLEHHYKGICHPFRRDHRRVDHATGGHRKQAGEDFRMLHADAKCSIAAQRMTGEAAAHPIRNRAVVAIDVIDQFNSDERFPIPGGLRAGIEAAIF